MLDKIIKITKNNHIKIKKSILKVSKVSRKSKVIFRRRWGVLEVEKKKIEEKK